MTRRRAPSYSPGKMKTTTKMTSKGQIVVPKAVRDGLGWRTGTRLLVDSNGSGELRLRRAEVAPGEDVIARLSGCLVGYDILSALEADHRVEIEEDEARTRRFFTRLKSVAKRPPRRTR